MSPTSPTQRHQLDTDHQHSHEDVAGGPAGAPRADTPREYPIIRMIGKYIVCVSTGFVFGFAMEKGRVFEPVIIHKMMLLKNFTMLKMFLSAMSAGMFSMSILAILRASHRRFINVCGEFYKDLSTKSVTSSLVGGLLIGAGMPLAGSCPTSVFTQIGAMVPNAGQTLYGGLVATLLYGMFKPRFDRAFRPQIKESSNPWKRSPYFVMAIPLAAMFGGLVYAFETLVPWTIEIEVVPNTAGILAEKAWPPYRAGMIIGSLQIPLIVGIAQTLGGTSSLITIVAQPFVGPLRKLSPYLASFQSGFQSWWQVFYVGGVTLGAYTSASLSESLGSVAGVPAHYAFRGGFLMMLGARIAGGCTSGHGITGMGLMSILSLITVSAMFSAGIATGFAMKYANMIEL